MSNRFVRPVYDDNNKNRQTLWLAHWKRTSGDAARECIGPSSSRAKELEFVTRNDNDLAEGLESSSRSAKGLEMIRARTSEIGYGAIKISSKSIGNERMLGSLFNDGQDTDGIQHEVDKGKAASSAVSKQSRSSKRLLECEECYKDRNSADLFFERKTDCHSQPGNSAKACFKQIITHDHYLSTYGCNRSAKTQKSSGMRLFPSQCISSEESETKKSQNDCCHQLKLQNSVDGVETMQICATADASEVMPEGCSVFLQTTNGLLITKRTDVNAFKENDMLKNKRLIANTKGNISNEFHCLLPISGHGKQKLILQPLNSLTDSEVKETMGDVKGFKAVIRNESSVQTDTMNMDCFGEENSKKEPHSGSNSRASNKTSIYEMLQSPREIHMQSGDSEHVFNLKSNIPALSNVASTREVLPHINSQLPAIPRAATSSEGMRRKTLEMEKLLEQAKPKSNINLDCFPNADPGDRWVKRLKLSSPNPSAQGTKSLNFASSSSSQVKISKLFGGIPKISTARSAAALEKSVVLGKSEEILKEKGKEASVLSDAWIKRWLYNERETKCEAEVVCEPMLPSIAAMALMGKTLTYLQPCEFRKRGSCTVWNIKAF